MGKSLIPINYGINFQESIFWLNAARMLKPDGNIEAVTWEADGVVGFDDVVVEYKGKKLDESTGLDIHADYYQVKHHMNKGQLFSVNSFVDPTFIGATSVSLLQKLQAQYAKNATDGKNRRFILINTWGLDGSDPIGSLIGTGGVILLDKLFDQTTDRSEMGKVRKLWRDHLGLKTDDELKELVRHLRVRTDFIDLHRIRELLNPQLELAGLIPFPEDRVQNKYFNLIPTLHGQSRNRFTPDELKVLCISEKLMIAKISEAAYGVGIRTFMQGAEGLEKETQELLCLSHLYNGRKIVDHGEWSSQVFPSVESFVSALIAKQNKIVFSFDTHLTLAYAVGYCIDPKKGKTVSVLQKTKNNKIHWEPAFDQTFKEEELFEWEELIVNPEGNEVAIALSVTHNTFPDVAAFVKDSLPQVGRIFHAKVTPGPSVQALRDGTHVLHLAQALALKISNARKPEERFEKQHVFMAAPNAFAFFFGQYSKVLGKIVLYELANFPPTKAGDYQESLTFPHQI